MKISCKTSKLGTEFVISTTRTPEDNDNKEPFNAPK